MPEICELHGRLRCSECAYVEELKEDRQELANDNFSLNMTVDQQREEIKSLRAELKEKDEVRQTNAALLAGCRAVYSDMQHNETLKYYESNPKEFVAIVVNTLGLILTKYDKGEGQ